MLQICNGFFLICCKFCDKSNANPLQSCNEFATTIPFPRLRRSQGLQDGALALHYQYASTPSWEICWNPLKLGWTSSPATLHFRNPTAANLIQWKNSSLEIIKSRVINSLSPPRGTTPIVQDIVILNLFLGHKLHSSMFWLWALCTITMGGMYTMAVVTPVMLSYGFCHWHSRTMTVMRMWWCSETYILVGSASNLLHILSFGLEM